MGFGTSGPSLADIAAVTGNNRNNGMDGGWGEWIWAFLIFALFGWGGFGNGWGGNGGNNALQPALTRGELCQDMNFQDVKTGVAAANSAIENGFARLNSTICQQQYDTAQMFNAQTISNLQSANALQAQLADCCCQNREAIAQVRYDMAQNTCAITNQMNTNTRDIIDSQNAGTRAILDYLCQEKIADLESENAQLRLSASQFAQNQYLVNALRPAPVPAYNVPNPYAYGGSCGCGCGNQYYYAA